MTAWRLERQKMGSIKGASKSSFYRFSTDDERLVVITDPSHRLYDKRVEIPINEGMVESIASEGILSPVKVRKVGDNYEVVFGRQRVRCAREAARRYPDRKILIPAIPATLNEVEALLHATIENVQRVDDPPSVRGFNAARLREKGYTDEELERAYGVKIGTIDDWIAFYELASEPVREAADDGKISYTKAREISRKPFDKQAQAVEKALETPRPRPGPKKGQKRRRRIVITAYECEEGGFDVQVDSKCRLDEFGAILESLDSEFEEWKTISGVENE
jgi:ParB family transcriptional regulator, chromosome partitioning protein